MADRFIPFRRLALLALGGILACGGDTAGPAADLVVYRPGLDRRLGPPLGRRGCGRGDTIVAVGDSAAIARTGRGGDPGARQRRRDGGARVHGRAPPLHGRRVPARQRGSPAGRRRPEEFVARLAAFAAEKQPGEWILGGDWDHERWEGAPLPRRDWIDSVTPNNPVFVYRLDGHMALANSAALRAGRDRPGHPGHPGRGDRARPAHRRAHRDPQGRGAGAGLRGRPGRHRRAQRDAALRRAMEHAASRGVTTIGVYWYSVALVRARRLPPRPRRGRASRSAPRSISRSQDWRAGGRHGGPHRTGRRLGLDRRGEGVRGRLARLDHRALLRALQRRADHPGRAS